MKQIMFLSLITWCVQAFHPFSTYTWQFDAFIFILQGIDSNSYSNQCFPKKKTKKNPTSIPAPLLINFQNASCTFQVCWP